jgi:hypothetical protein
MDKSDYNDRCGKASTEKELVHILACMGQQQARALPYIYLHTEYGLITYTTTPTCLLRGVDENKSVTRHYGLSSSHKYEFRGTRDLAGAR